MSQAGSSQVRVWSRGFNKDIVIIGTIIMLGVTVALLYGPLPIDDAYITFRYARNLSDGMGFVYNPGERVLGTSTPLFTLLLALVHLISGLELVTISFVLGMLAFSLSSIPLFLIGRLVGGKWLGATMALLFVLNPWAVYGATSGMETPVYILLILLTFWAQLRHRHSMAMLFAGLAFLVRPDGLILTPILFIHYVLARRRFPLRESLCWLAVTVPWLLFAQIYFDSPLPQSVAAKWVAYAPLRDGLSAFNSFREHFVTMFLSPSGNWLAEAIQLIVALGTTIALAIGWIGLFRSKRSLAPTVVFPILYLASFSVANRMIFTWYLVPLVPFYLLGIMTGLRSLASRAEPGLSGLFKITDRPGSVRGYASFAVVATVLVVASIAETSRNQAVLHEALGQRERVYQQIATDLAPQVGEQVTIASPEIGALGYFSPGRILDLTGLVSPVAVSYFTTYDQPADYQGMFQASAGLLEASRPEYIVSIDFMLPESWLAEQLDAGRYRLQQRHDVFLWGHDRQILVLARSDQDR